jgi:hypothetical protein
MAMPRPAEEDASMLSFVIYGPFRTEELARSLPAAEQSGGAVALMTLGRLLREQGCGVEFVGFDGEAQRERCRAPAERGEIVAVYPEAIRDNPLGAKKVVRWALYYIAADTLARWEREGDLLFFYWDAFHPQRRADRLLTLMRLDLDAFFDAGRPRSGVAYRIAKGAEYHACFDYHKPAALRAALEDVLSKGHALDPGLLSAPDEEVEEVPSAVSKAAMHEVFTRCRLFVSYDADTALSCFAALCGCVSVIVPRPGWRQEDLPPCYRYGIAYGYEDIPRALHTRTRLRSLLARMEAEGPARTAAFVNAVRERFEPGIVF